MTRIMYESEGALEAPEESVYVLDEAGNPVKVEVPDDVDDDPS